MEGYLHQKKEYDVVQHYAQNKKVFLVTALDLK